MTQHQEIEKYIYHYWSDNIIKLKYKYMCMKQKKEMGELGVRNNLCRAID
jgi:hypothetical protein